jgi:hypothetical protein
MSAELAANPRSTRAAIIADLATALRNSDGHATNIESAIATTGVSASEIAALFGGNRELMLAMVAKLSETMCAPLSTGSADLRQRLFDFGQRVTDTYANSHLRALYRIAITESIRHTGLARDFYESGPGHLTQCLADFLQDAQHRGELGSADPHLLASHFLAALRTHLDVADTFSHGPSIRRVVDGAYVRNVVDLFFDGIDGGRRSC